MHEKKVKITIVIIESTDEVQVPSATLHLGMRYLTTRLPATLAVSYHLLPIPSVDDNVRGGFVESYPSTMMSGREGRAIISAALSRAADIE